MKDIIVVEDMADERKRLEQLFKDDGYSVVLCDSAAVAEKHLKHESFRLAILDIGLSDKSGSYLFNDIKRGGRVSYIIIFTGNPSVHLKQRFLDEGAVDYIVKASPQASNDSLLQRVKEIIGSAQKQAHEGIELEEFINRYLAEKSRQLFLDMDNSLPECKTCSGKRYIVTFAHKPQVPPEIQGLVVCSSCGSPMDPDVE